MERPLSGVHCLGWNELRMPTTAEPDAPSLAVHDDVMPLIQQAHIIKFRLTPIQPRDDAMSLAITRLAITPGKSTSLIAMSKSGTYRGSGQPVLAPDV